MMSNLCTRTPWGAPPPQKKIGGGEIFSHHLRVRAWSKLFLAIVPEKEYPKLVLKFWGLPLTNFAGGKSYAKFSDFLTFSPISPKSCEISTI